MSDESNQSQKEELTRKRLAGMERRRLEDLLAQKDAKPGFKLITRGPRKGQVVRKNYREL